MEEEGLTLKDIVAFIIALLSTHLLPVILLGIIMIVITLIIVYLT